MLKIGIIGCGYSSYYYCISLLNYPDVKLIGVYDRNDHKSVLLSQHQKCRKYFTFQEMLNDKEIDMIVIEWFGRVPMHRDNLFLYESLYGVLPTRMASIN